MRVPDAFAQFHDKIVLGTLSEERINRAWGVLHVFLTGTFQVPDTHVYIQGSYANDTAVKPADEDGEYDLDIVSLHVAPGTAADRALDDLTAALEADGRFADRVEPDETGRPCVRLRYAADPQGFGFHIDIVPATGTAVEEPIDVPMRGREGWRPSHPAAYTAWCQQQPELFRRVVRFLKRWRDVHGDGSIASIVLQVLIATHLPSATAADDEAVWTTLTNIKGTLDLSPDAPPPIANPVLPSENLADRWDEGDYREFRAELDEAVELAGSALFATEAAATHRHWRTLFGDAFPATPANNAGPLAPPPPPDYPDARGSAPTDERYG